MTDTQEIKTVSFEEYMRGMLELREKNKGCGSRIEIIDVGGALGGFPIQAGVNWASIGTVSPEKAEEFARTLSEAIEDCKNFKYNGYVIDWTAPFRVQKNH